MVTQTELKFLSRVDRYSPRKKKDGVLKQITMAVQHT